MKKVRKVSKLGIKKGDKVLFFHPHPDDEAVFTAGLMAKLASKGAKVLSVTITKGEASTLRFGCEDDEDLATCRTKELSKALKILGVDKYEIWDVPDGKIFENRKNVRKKIKVKVKKFNPDHIITLEPSGIYGHPDHVALSEIITNLKETYYKNINLIYATVSKKFKASSGARSLRDNSKKIKRIQPNVKLKLSLWDTFKKLRSLLAHKSQFGGNLKMSFVKWVVRDVLRSEYYYHNNQSSNFNKK